MQSGKLKAFYSYGKDARLQPVKLISTRMGQLKECFWLIDCGDCDRYCSGWDHIIVDVTPEKRYAVWNHTLQRFARFYEEHATTFKSKAEAEAYLEGNAINFSNKHYFYVVEWELKQDD